MKKIFGFLIFLVLLISGCEKKSSIEGNWEIDSLEKDGVFQKIVISYIEFEKNEIGSYNIFGNSGVNSFFGNAQIKGNSILIGDNLGSTKMAGSPAAMEYEDNFMQVLIASKKIEIIEEGNTVFLKIYADEEKTVLTFRKANRE